MKKLNSKYLVLSAVVFLWHFTGFGQSDFKLNESQSRLVIKGTSTIHEWKIDVAGFTCEASFLQGGDQGVTVSGVNFVCLVENVKSENKIMNNKTHDALKGDKFPEIKFNSIGKVSGSTAAAESKIHGKLTIAGKTNDVMLQFKVVGETQNQIKVVGETRLKMSDYGIDPPVAMMGALKTDDEVVITYDIVFQKTQEIN